MEKTVEKRIAITTLGWSMLGAIASIGSALANKFAGAPDIAIWIIALWWAGLGIAVASGLRGNQ